MKEFTVSNSEAGNVILTRGRRSINPQRLNVYRCIKKYMLFSMKGCWMMIFFGTPERRITRCLFFLHKW